MSKTSLLGTWDLSSKTIHLTTTIPGDFHSSLLEEKIIPDPYYGFNEQHVQWVGRTDWEIKRKFNYIKLEETRAILEITEIDTFFTVFLNNKEIGKGKDQFSRHRFDVTSAINNGSNEIRIVFDSPEKICTELAKSLPYPIPHSVYDVQSPHRNLARKSQCNGGWDWGPCIMVSGIYGDIFIETTSDGIFDNLTVSYKLTEEESNVWTAYVSSVFNSYIEGEKEFTFSINGEGLEINEVVKANIKEGKNKISAEIKVKNPYIWKTSGELKEENRTENTIYKLTVSEEDTVLGEISKSKNICFSSLRVVSEKDNSFGRDGRCLYFENNKRKIFAKGSNWIPCDTLPSRMTEERYKELLQAAVDANQNIIRIWGGGIFEKEIFYDTCDKLGIIIWQDMMFSCALYPSTKDFLNEVRKELDYQIPRLQSHACIGIWCGNNEAFGSMNWYEESKNDKTKYICDYDRLYYGVVAEKVNELDPSRIFWPSSPSSGPDDYADNWKSDNSGDMHYWEVWHSQGKFSKYQSITPRFVSEFGYESFPSMDTIKSFAEEKDFNFTSKLMEYHQRSPSGNSIIIENFSRYFRFPVGFENMIYLSQVQQAIAIKTAVEYWRSLKPHCMGSIIWQLNDIWPGPSWSSLEYNGKWKLLHYEEKKFYDPFYLSLFMKENTLHASICNDLNQDLETELTIKFLKFDGTEYKKAEVIKSTIKAEETKEVFSKKISQKEATNFFIYGELKGTNEKEETIKRDGTAFPALYKHCKLGNSKVTFEIEKKEKTFEIDIKTDLPAFFVAFDTIGIKGRFNDNMFTLLPNKTKKIIFTCKDNLTLDEFKKALSWKDLRHTY